MSFCRYISGALFVAVLALVPAAYTSDMTANAELRQLAHTLSGAYSNAMRHDADAANLDSEDLNLERASIRLSSLIAHEVAANCSATIQRARSSDQNCALSGGSADLRNLSDTLSYAASRLENQGRMAARSRTANPLHQVRIGSLEHLYRTVFALARLYLDRDQGTIYLAAARQQIGLARTNLEEERRLCACDPAHYSARLDDLSELDSALQQISAGS